MPSRQTDPGSEETRRAPRRGTRLRRKLLLAAGSLLATIAVLEVVSRLIMPGLGPVFVREGLYTNPLPLVTGQAGPPIPLGALPSGERLSFEKGEHEVRVFVLGESSVAGSPLDVHASMPAMLLDDLSRRLPGKRFTVVNMGRPGSVAANAFYYLSYIEQYDPDFIVFFMGMNDGHRMLGEHRAPVSSPTLYAIWRTAVEHSRTLWLVRTYGVQFLWALSGRSRWYGEEEVEPVRSFHAWTSILVEAARDTGATVVVASPVLSAATTLEPKFGGDPHSTTAPLSQTYGELLACELTADCDLSARLIEVLEQTPANEGALVEWPPAWCDWLVDAQTKLASDPANERLTALCRRWKTKPAPSMMDEHDELIAYRTASWKRAAEEGGAAFIDFERALAMVSPHHVLAEKFFADRVHLTVQGYLYLARMVAARIARVLTDAPEAPVSLPGIEEAAVYLSRTYQSGVQIAFEQLVRGWHITGLPQLRYAVEASTPERCRRKGFCEEIDEARLAIGWLRTRVGLAHGLPADLAAKLPDFDPVGTLERLRGPKDK